MLTINHIALHSEMPQRFNLSIDLPRATQIIDDLDFNIAGWVIGQEIDNVIAFDGSSILDRVPVNLHRPDVTRAFAWVPDLENKPTGFCLHISRIFLPAVFTIQVILVLPNKEWVKMATIQGHQQKFTSTVSTSLSMVGVSAYGRSGTTMLMQMLQAHPEIVVAGNYPYEIFQVLYWAKILSFITATQTRFNGNYRTPNKPDWLRYGFHSWEVLQNEYKVGHDSDGFMRWQRDHYRQDVAEFCLERIDSYYGQIAQTQKKPEVRYFAEKMLFENEGVRSLFPTVRELILVRDPRDIFTSILAFNDKRNDMSGFELGDFPNHKTFITRFVEYIRRNLAYLDANPEKTFLVRYEHLVERPDEMLADIFTFLGLDASPDTIRAILKPQEKVESDYKRHRTSNSGSQSIGRWKQELSDEMKLFFEEVASDVLQRMNY